MSEPAAPPSPSRFRLFWQRHVIDPVVVQLTQGITPEKIALTLAVGSACALFPILGTATLLCFFVGVLLKLNQPIIQLVNALCTIPHLLVTYCLIRFGNAIFHVPTDFNYRDFIYHRGPHTHISFWAILEMLWDDPSRVVHELGATALHALVAWAIVVPFWCLAIYLLTLPGLRNNARLRALEAINVANTPAKN